MKKQEYNCLDSIVFGCKLSRKGYNPNNASSKYLKPEEFGALFYLKMLPDDWNFSIGGMARMDQFQHHGKHMWRKLINSLIDKGFCVRSRVMDHEDAPPVWKYCFFENPLMNPYLCEKLFALYLNGGYKALKGIFTCPGTWIEDGVEHVVKVQITDHRNAYFYTDLEGGIKCQDLSEFDQEAYNNDIGVREAEEKAAEENYAKKRAAILEDESGRFDLDVDGDYAFDGDVESEIYASSLVETGPQGVFTPVVEEIINNLRSEKNTLIDKIRNDMKVSENVLQEELHVRHYDNLINKKLYPSFSSNTLSGLDETVADSENENSSQRSKIERKLVYNYNSLYSVKNIAARLDLDNQNKLTNAHAREILKIGSKKYILSEYNLTPEKAKRIKSMIGAKNLSSIFENFEHWNTLTPHQKTYLIEWLEYKNKDRRDSYKPLGLRKLIKQFAAQPPDILKECVDKAMHCNYVGVFFPPPASSPGQKQAAVAHMEALPAMENWEELSKTPGLEPKVEFVAHMHKLIAAMEKVPGLQKEYLKNPWITMDFYAWIRGDNGFRETVVSFVSLCCRAMPLFWKNPELKELFLKGEVNRFAYKARDIHG